MKSIVLFAKDNINISPVLIEVEGLASVKLGVYLGFIHNIQFYTPYQTFYLYHNSLLSKP